MCASGRRTQVSPARAPSAAASAPVGSSAATSATATGAATERAAVSAAARSAPSASSRRNRSRARARSRSCAETAVGTVLFAHGPSGTRMPGPGGGTAPRVGRPPNGRVGSGVVNGESTYQNGSARRPESTSARAVGSAVARASTSERNAARSASERDEEVHGRRRHREVLAGRGVPLRVVALEQLLRRPAVPDVRDLPRGVLRVGHPGVQPARAERRHQVRDVAREQHPADPEPVRDPGVEPVHRPPDDLVGRAPR